MASSSSSRPHQTLKITSNNKMEQHNLVEQDQNKVSSSEIIGHQEEKEDDEWLKLGLGLGTSSTDTASCKNKIICQGSKPVLLYSPSSSSSQGVIISHHHQVGLGLGLGFERGSLLGPTRDNNIEGVGLSTVEPSVSYHHHHHRSSLLGWSSSSSSSSGHCNYYYYHHHHHHSNDDDDGNGMNKLRPSSSPSFQIESHQVVGLPISVPYCDQSYHHHHNHYPHQNHGLWFTLRSSSNRSEEALPQVAKAYIRVRDENMTVLMVKKYLVRKLGLSNETEIEISCMGQSLSQIQTLKEVRDGVWLPRLVESLNSANLSLGDDSHNDDMSLNQHIMSLLYRKHCFSN